MILTKVDPRTCFTSCWHALLQVLSPRHASGSSRNDDFDKSWSTHSHARVHLHHRYSFCLLYQYKRTNTGAAKAQWPTPFSLYKSTCFLVQKYKYWRSKSTAAYAFVPKPTWVVIEAGSSMGMCHMQGAFELKHVRGLAKALHLWGWTKACQKLTKALLAAAGSSMVICHITICFTYKYIHSCIYICIQHMQSKTSRSQFMFTIYFFLFFFLKPLARH